VTSHLGVLRHPNFRYLFLGQSASAIGDRVVVVAIALFVTQRTGSATDLGLVLGSQELPLVALLLFGGVWADRLPRHRIMISADWARATLHGALAALIFTGAVRVWELCVIEALFGAAMAFFQPAYTGLIPQTVPEPLIQEARALTQSMENIAFLIGPALATGLVLGVGAGEAFAFDAGTFILSAWLLRRVRPRQRGETAAPEPVWQELLAGFDEVRSRPWVWVTIAVFAGALLCVFVPWYALAPIVARGSYGSAGVFGLLESVAGAGAVCGAVAGVRWRPAHPLKTGLLLVLGWPLLGLLFASRAPLEFVTMVALANGFGFALLMIWWETALAEHIPPHALSRVSAYDWMGSLALVPLGYLIVGPVSDALGVRTALGFGAVLGAGLLVLALVPRSTRALGGGPSAQQLSRDVGVEAGSEAEIAHIDSLVRTVDERSGVEHRHVALREEPVGDAIRKRLAEPARVRETRQDHGDGRGSLVVDGDPARDRLHERRVDRRGVS
jgi:MFS family permease